MRKSRPYYSHSSFSFSACGRRSEDDEHLQERRDRPKGDACSFLCYTPLPPSPFCPSPSEDASSLLTLVVFSPSTSPPPPPPPPSAPAFAEKEEESHRVAVAVPLNPELAQSDTNKTPGKAARREDRGEERVLCGGLDSTLIHD